MFIYKITCLINNKIYIGQTINSIDHRFKRHIQDAESGRLDTHLARAIRKYKPENFVVELVDTASSQEELTQKEYYWIHYYNSIEDGYNETDSFYKSGGNTYKSKTKEEMKNIGNKISKSKLGAKNPHSHKVKCKNVNTGEEHHFDTNKAMQDFFKESNHNFITRRCLGKTKCLYKKEWLIAYEENNYPTDFTIEKGSRKAKRIKLIDLSNDMEYNFPSFAAAERFFNLPQKGLSGSAYRKGKHFICYNRFEITVLD